MVFRQVFRAFPCCNHAKSAGACPVHQFADQCRLVAVGQRIDDAGAFRLARQGDAGQHVGFDVHHDDVFALRDGAAGVRDAGGRVAGGFDHDFQIGCCHHRHGVIGEARGLDACCVPADAAAGGARSIGREIGDCGDLDSRCRRHLCQEHRAEFPGADQPDPHRPVGGEALLQQPMQVHAWSPFTGG